MLHVNGCGRQEARVQVTAVLFITIVKHNCISSGRQELHGSMQEGSSVSRNYLAYLSSEIANSATTKSLLP